MKASLFTEEGRTKRSGRHLLMFLALIWLGVSSFGGYLVYQYHTKANLTPLQRVYLPEYWRSARRSLLPFDPQSAYLLLTRTGVDPKTKKDTLVFCSEQQVNFIFDEDGKLQLTQDNLPDVRLKPEYGTQAGPLPWTKLTMHDKLMYGWFRQYFYEGMGAFDLLFPSMLVGAFIFFPRRN
jgi:hypothetical protein